MGREGYQNLSSLSDVRKFLSKLINQRNNNQIASAKYRDLCFGLKIMREVLEAMFLQSEVLERLAHLEGQTYIPPSLPNGNGNDDDDLDEPETEAEGEREWA